MRGDTIYFEQFSLNYHYMGLTVEPSRRLVRSHIIAETKVSTDHLLSIELDFRLSSLGPTMESYNTRFSIIMQQGFRIFFNIALWVTIPFLFRGAYGPGQPEPDPGLACFASGLNM